MKLQSLQRAVAHAVMQPLTPADRMRRVSLDGKSMRSLARRIIKPNDRLSSFERLEIYNRQYWFRVLSSMMEDFPGLRAVVGAKRFDRLAQAYLVDCPSRSFTLRDLGSRLEQWLRKNPKWIAGRHRLALDMVRLEWAEIEAFDAAALPPLKPIELSSSNQNYLRVRLQPYIRLLALAYPVDDLLIEVRRLEDEGPTVASNAYDSRHKAHGAKLRRCKPESIFLAVHRIEDSVYFRRLEPAEFALLRSLQRGQSLRAAIAAAFPGSSTNANPDKQADTVRTWFHNWSALGWFCKPAPGPYRKK